MKIIFSIIVIVAIGVLGFFVMETVKPNQEASNRGSKVQANNVSIVDDVQIIEIKAKGGYIPRASVAKAGVPTTLRFNTEGTFDCTSQVRIPSMKISQSLPPSGVTDIDLGVLKVGILEGTCGMGMYPFEINVQS